MSFNSFWFFVFFAASALIYYSTPKSKRKFVLLAASLLFYLASDIRFIVFIAFSSVSAFYAGIVLGNLKKGEKTKRKTVVFFAVTANMSVLIFLKYYNFLGTSINVLTDAVFGIAPLPTFNLLLPLGISFYTFRTAGYIIDVYRGKYAPCRNFADFTLFTSYFPQIIQGPIGRFDELENQFVNPSDFSWDNVKFGIQLMLFGYFKKLIVADRLAVLVNHVFANYENYGGLTVFLSVFIYSVQLYCDFSGGIDIALGASEVLGIKLEENFKRPFFAVGVDDYWRRWHISLSRWMKDYLFYPVSFSKPFTRLGRFTRKRIGGHLGKIIPASLATFLVFIAVGIWQGASFKYIAYGMWNGALISLGMMFKPVSDKMSKKFKVNGVLKYALNISRTVFLITLGRYFSRAGSFMTALNMLKHTFSVFAPHEIIDGTFLNFGLSAYDCVVAAFGVSVLLLVGILQEKGVGIRVYLEKRNPYIQFAILFAGLCVLVFCGIFAQGYISSEFIYRQV